jgi:opacity protein-like surface antigen
MPGERQNPAAWPVAVLLALATAAAAEPPRPRALFGPGKQALGLSTGYGWGHELSGSKRDALDTQTIPVLPRWSIGLATLGPEGAFSRGVLEAAVEGLFLVNVQPRSGAAQGGGLALRYDFLSWQRVVPYFGVGAGILSVEYDLDTQADGLNFALFGEAGAHLLLAPRLALTGGYRLMHVSNARIATPNLGVDTSFGVVGVTVFP